MAKLEYLEIIKNPIYTSKAKQANSVENKLILKVNINADKESIKKAIEEIFQIKTLDINTIIVKGKAKSSSTHRNKKYYGVDYKKAIIKCEKSIRPDVKDKTFSLLSNDDFSQDTEQKEEINNNKNFK